MNSEDELRDSGEGGPGAVPVRRPHPGHGLEGRQPGGGRLLEDGNW